MTQTQQNVRIAQEGRSRPIFVPTKCVPLPGNYVCCFTSVQRIQLQIQVCLYPSCPCLPVYPIYIYNYISQLDLLSHLSPNWAPILGTTRKNLSQLHRLRLIFSAMLFCNGWLRKAKLFSSTASWLGKAPVMSWENQAQLCIIEPV